LGWTVPKNDQSAGKRRSNRIKKGAPWLKSTLIQCAWCASRTKGSYLQAQYCACVLAAERRKRLCCRGIHPHRIYHMLKNGTLYQDLGTSYFDNRAKDNRHCG